VADRVVFNGSGKLGLPDNAIVAFALGADTVSVCREAMLSIGCIQAQRCHTGECPTGIATQHRWLSRGLDPAVKSVSAANYIRSLRRDLLKVSEACGVSHPSLIGVDDLDILNGQESATPCAPSTNTNPTGAGHRRPTNTPSTRSWPGQTKTPSD
jgi:glutamate synthase domain-containing protein 2